MKTKNDLFATLATLVGLFCSGYSAYEIFINDLPTWMYLISFICAILAAVIVMDNLRRKL